MSMIGVAVAGLVFGVVLTLIALWYERNRRGR